MSAGGPAYVLEAVGECAAVKTTFGTFKGGAGALCLAGLAGAPVATCGGGSRIGRGVIDD